MRTDISMRIVGGLRIWHSLVLFALIAISVGGVVASRAWAQSPVPSTLVQAATPMLPYMDWLVDPSGTLTVEDMAAPAQQSAFRPLNVDKIDRESGTVWLRFTLAPRVVDTRPSTYLLDMGEGVPGTPTLYVPKHNVLTNTTTWQDFTPSQRSIFLMPDAQTSPTTAYIKMSGMPGLWFAPMLRTPHNAATALERLLRPAVIVVLGVVMLLCLLRGLAERGEWRFWTSLYTGAALLHSVWGVPMLAKGAVPMEEIAAVLAPGVALMLLPHVGRHLMRTREKSKIIDLQYILLALPGAALALLPLVPGFSWTIRYLDLWPLGTLLLVPTTLGAWMMGLAGARRFLLGCLLPPLATAAGLLGIGYSVPTPLLATAPLWGVALSALIIAGTAATYAPLESEAAAHRDNPLNDPALRIVTPEELAQEASTLSDPIVWEKDAPSRVPADSTALAWEEKLRAPMDVLLREGAALGTCSLPPVARQHAQKVQETVRDMLNMLAQPLDRAEQSEESTAMDADCFDLQQLIRDAHDSVATSAENKNIALSWFMPPHLVTRFVGDGRRLALSVRLLLESAVRATSRGGVQVSVRRVPESVDPGHLLFSVTDTGAGMPPHDRSSMAVARAWELAAVHRGFLGVECSPHGTSVSFTVRLVAASAVAGGVSDAEASLPVRGRPNLNTSAPSSYDPTAQGIGEPQDTGLVTTSEDEQPLSNLGPDLLIVQPIDQQAAQNAPAGNGAQSAGMGIAPVGAGLGVDAPLAAPQRGALPRIIIADDSLSNRQLLAFFLEGLPYSTVEARSPDEAAELYTASPAALIIFDGDMPEEDTLNAVSRIHALEAEYNLPAALILALTTDDSRWEFLHEGGFTHALVKPVSRTGLRRTVQELLPEGTVAVPPLSMAFAPGNIPASADADEIIENAEAMASVPFGLSEAERVKAEADATQVAWMDDSLASSASAGGDAAGDGIIDTGEPLPAPEPLRMSPDPNPPAQSTTAKRAKNENRILLPVMDTSPEGRVQNSSMPRNLPGVNSAQIMPELASMAPVAPVDAVDTDDSDKTAVPNSVDRPSFLQPGEAATNTPEQDAEVEEVYPYPLHANGTTTVATVAAQSAGTSHVDDHKVALLDHPAHDDIAHAEGAAGVTASSVADASFSTTDENGKTTRVFTSVAPEHTEENTDKCSAVVESLEWVGDPMPVGSTSDPQASAKPSRGVSAIPTWMRDSVAPHLESGTSHAPSHSAEWVGDPVPIIRPVKAELEDTQLVPQPAEMEAPHESRRTVVASPVAEERNTTRDADTVKAEIMDGPSRIEDLLLPFTQSTIAAEDDLADTDVSAELPQKQDSQQAFIPLSLATVSAAPVNPASVGAKPAAAPAPAVAPVPSVAPVPAPAVAPVVSVENPAATAPKHEDQRHAERLSLIPEESSLMDFIISPEPSSDKAIEKPAEKPASASSTTPSITITTVATPRKVATATFTLNSSSKDTKADSVKADTAVTQVAVNQSVPAPVSATAVAAPQAVAQTPAQSGQSIGQAAASVTPAASAAPVVSAAPAAVGTPAEAGDSPIPTMLKEFDEAMVYARGGYARKNIQAVLEAAEYIASRSETCGLRVLARMARCVGEAAKAGDTEALNNLLPELETAVERNKIALQKK